MSASSGDDITALLSDLVRTLQDLETEVEPTTESGRPRPPTPKELLRFTSDVTIPAAILVLKTNIEALKLLRRALRLADGRPASTGTDADAVRRRALGLSEATLARLDDALADLQDAVEGRPRDADARELLDEARDLRADLAEQVAAARDRTDSDVDGSIDEAVDGAAVPVDVDAELESIKDDIEDADDGDEDGVAAS